MLESAVRYQYVPLWGKCAMCKASLIRNKLLYKRGAFVNLFCSQEDAYNFMNGSQICYRGMSLQNYRNKF